jgi:hypothetical protein
MNKKKIKQLAKKFENEGSGYGRILGESDEMYVRRVHQGWLQWAIDNIGVIDTSKELQVEFQSSIDKRNKWQTSIIVKVGK